MNWPLCYFNQRSYSRWAANEILELVMDNPFSTPIDIIEEFIIKMDYFSCIDLSTSLIFSIAKDTAEDILYLFL